MPTRLQLLVVVSPLLGACHRLSNRYDALLVQCGVPSSSVAADAATRFVQITAALPAELAAWSGGTPLRVPPRGCVDASALPPEAVVTVTAKARGLAGQWLAGDLADETSVAARPLVPVA